MDIFGKLKFIGPRAYAEIAVKNREKPRLQSLSEVRYLKNLRRTSRYYGTELCGCIEVANYSRIQIEDNQIMISYKDNPI